MENYDTPAVSIILPVFNEESSLSVVIESIRKSMANFNENYEIIAADDGSTDKSKEIATQMGVRLLPGDVNKGAGNARKRGIKAAKGDFVVFLDADATYQTDDIPKMLELRSENDQINGARDRDHGSLLWLRVSVKFCLRILASLLACQYIPDLNTGLKVMRRKVLMNYVDLIPDGFSCVTTMTLSFLVRGHRVKYVKTTYNPRIGKSKFHPIKDTLNLIKAIFRTVTILRPERVALFLGMIGYITYALISKEGINKAIHISYSFSLYFVLSLTTGHFFNKQVEQG
jgi:polyisoprenyl-phosphate glycosyltransferase